MNKNIAETEKRWLKKLFDYNRHEFSGYDLPSHDQYHHLRVWYYARYLLTELEKAGFHISRDLPEKLIFAVFFHDIGLTRTLDVEHGKFSRQICSEYLQKNNIRFTDGEDELLQAIEMHDDKSYFEKCISENSGPVSVYNLLTVCDDLDAFGAIGVFRYLEIYLLRNIPVRELPEKIIANIKTRFDNFKSRYYFLDEYIAKHKRRYEYTASFYRDFASSFRKNPVEKPFGKDSATVIEWLNENFINKKTVLIPENITNSTGTANTYLGEFINELRNELLVAESVL